MKAGSRLGEYRLTARLAEDAFGTLHRAVRVEGGAFGRHALIRRFAPRWLGAGLRVALAEALPQSLRLGEARGLAPHCRIYHQAAEPWISYDLDPGLTLAELLQLCRAQGMTLGLEHALTVMRDLATVLEHLHERNVAHGLLVPELVWVTHEGSVSLLDAPVAPQLRRVLGTARVPGLEVLAQAPPSGAPRDLYLLACLGWRMLTLEPVVPSSIEALLAALETWARASEGGLPSSLRHLFARMVGRETPFQDLGEFQAESGIALQLDEYAPSTFNLAFLVHSLLRERIPAELRELEAERAATWTVSTEVPALRESVPLAPQPARSWKGLGLAAALLLAAGSGVFFSQRSGARETEDLRKALADAQRHQAERDQNQADVEASLKLESERKARLQAQLAESRDTAKLEALQRELEAVRVRQLELNARQARAKAEAEEAATQAQRLQARSGALPSAPKPAAAMAPLLDPPKVPPTPAPVVRVPVAPLDAPARLLSMAGWARPSGFHGPLRLRVFVSEEGRPLRALVIEGAGGAIDAAATEAALRSTYQPALAGGKPVRAWLEVEFTSK
ncbi:MAG TPA: energy transducer TonB [Holophagaceae bacterium]|nr:energy transducer TonB [Holophagaceae bacterium]